MSPKWFSGPMGPPNAQIYLTADNNGQCNLGEQVKGIVKFNSDEEFDVRQLIVQLSCLETVRQAGVGIQIGLVPIQNVSSFNSVEIYRDARVLFGAAHVPKGFAGKYSYALNVSAGARETLYSVDRSVRWQLCAITRSIKSS